MNHSNLGLVICCREEQFELSLERYGIRNCKASGKVRHFLDLKGQFKVSFSIPIYISVELESDIGFEIHVLVCVCVFMLEFRV